jgi:hypothetical protein
MINSSDLSSPLSPRPVQRQKRSPLLFWIPICLLLVFGCVAVGLAFLLPNGGESLPTRETKNQINNNAEKIVFGEYEICDWAKVKADTHIPLFFDGQSKGFF